MACDFSIYLPPETPQPIEVGQTALDEIETMEDLLTVYRADSAMSFVNQQAATAPVRVDARLYELLKRAAQITEQTEGALMYLPAGESLGVFRGPRRVPDDAERIAALARSGMSASI